RRARAHLEQVGLSEDSVTEPTEPRQRELLDRYVRAFETKNIPAIVALFTTDSVWEMPPFSSWFLGAAAIGRLINLQCPAVPGGMRMVPTVANGQPAFGLYVRETPDSGFTAFNLHVLTLDGSAVRRVTAFFDLRLFPTF